MPPTAALIPPPLDPLPPADRGVMKSPPPKNTTSHPRQPRAKAGGTVASRHKQPSPPPDTRMQRRPTHPPRLTPDETEAHERCDSVQEKNNIAYKYTNNRIVQPLSRGTFERVTISDHNCGRNDSRPPAIAPYTPRVRTRQRCNSRPRG